MFDLGWLELMVIGITALIVVGPKELPQMFRTVGRFFGKAKAMAREFSQSMEDAANESGLKDATNTLNSISDMHKKTKTPIKEQVVKSFQDRIDPIQESINSSDNFSVGDESFEEKVLIKTPTDQKINNKAKSKQKK
ncbi:MAG: twin-arginine translocase subunit TatB [Rhodobacteraceae bacterium]|nr:twin-arginine translocase subunit TatB [Paracoccaceae bacterium]|tara:strand:+ start:207 stop:617 length:411 start_codon:yes stop_codon:yes gene_type:complete